MYTLIEEKENRDHNLDDLGYHIGYWEKNAQGEERKFPLMYCDYIINTSNREERE